MALGDVNFLAVAVATVLTFVLGGLWYSPLLFAKPWMAAHGYSESQLKEMQGSAMPAYVVSFIAWFVMATVLAMVAPSVGEGVGATLHAGLILWIGFAATTGLTGNMFSTKPLRAWYIDAGYQLGSVAVMSTVLGLWR